MAAETAATSAAATDDALDAAARRRLAWAAAAADLTRGVLQRGDDETATWQELAERLTVLTGATAVTVATERPGNPSRSRVVAATGPGAGGLIGQEHEGPDDLAGPTSGVLTVPLRGEGGTRGVVRVTRSPDAAPSGWPDRELVEDLVAQTTVAVELAEARADRQRWQEVEAREQIARDLQDRVVTRLFGVGLTLQNAAAATRSPATTARLAQVVEELDEAIRELRAAVFGLRPPAAG